MDISSIALQGLDRAQSQFESAALRLSAAGTGSPDGVPADTADLSDAAVALLSAKNAFSINIQTLKIAEKIQSHALDILA